MEPDIGGFASFLRGIIVAIGIEAKKRKRNMRAFSIFRLQQA
jgi:hypothetical protein